MDFIEDFTNKIRDAFAEVDPSQGQVFDAVRALEGSLEQMQELWDEGIEAAVQNYNAEQTVGDVASKATNENAATKGDAQKQAWGENGIDVSAKDGNNIETTAHENYNHLMEVLGYDTRDSGHRGQSNPAERQRLERIERTYRESTVRSEKDRNELCDAVRQAGGIQQRRVSIGSDVHADLNIFDRQFYTAEMLHAEAANKARGIDTVFFVDDIVDEYGDRFSVNGFSDSNTKTVYVKYNAKNEKDGSVSHWYRLNGKTVARYAGVQKLYGF